jgi:FixJ family two-component response regulator
VSTGLPVRRPPIVFVVDDDIAVRVALGALIHLEGWQAETFASAEGFPSRPRVVVPSCLVLDVADLNGLNLQKRLADRSDMPIIFITGNSDAPLTVQAMKARAVEFLMKPFSDEALLSAIRKAIDQSRAALDQQQETKGLRDRYAALIPDRLSAVR